MITPNSYTYGVGQVGSRWSLAIVWSRTCILLLRVPIIRLTGMVWAVLTQRQNTLFHCVCSATHYSSMLCNGIEWAQVLLCHLSFSLMTSWLLPSFLYQWINGRVCFFFFLFFFYCHIHTYVFFFFFLKKGVELEEWLH